MLIAAINARRLIVALPMIYKHPWSVHALTIRVFGAADAAGNPTTMWTATICRSSRRMAYDIGNMMNAR
jgi:hypothetical protein